MKPILIVCADAPAAASASPSAAASAAGFAFLIFPPPKKSLPRAVIDRVLEGRTRLDQAPAERPLISVIEALARVGHGRRVQDALELQRLRVEQPARLIDQILRVLTRILVNRPGGARFGAEHRGERRPVELVARGFAARREIG